MNFSVKREPHKFTCTLEVEHATAKITSLGSLQEVAAIEVCCRNYEILAGTSYLYT